jgi:hypothetical protein
VLTIAEEEYHTILVVSIITTDDFSLAVSWEAAFLLP